MKRIGLLASLFLISTVFLQAQQPPKQVAAPAKPTVTFNKFEHNFGKIKKDKPVTYVFSFTNNGSKPLLVENATAECGCTTPEYTKAPVLKGKTSTIKITFNAATPGPFTKKVTVKFLNVDQPTFLTIKGEVGKA